MVDAARLLASLADAVIAIDGNDRVGYLNAAATALLNWTREDLVGRPVETIVPPRLRAVGAASLYREAATRAAVRTTALRHDGVEIVVAITANPAEVVPGEPPWIVASLRPLEETVAFASATGGDEAREVHRLVFDNAPLGIIHFDRHGVITACNDQLARLLRSSKRLLIGLNMQTLHDAGIVACVVKAIGGDRAHYEGDYHSVTGNKTTPVRVDFTPIVSATGETVGGVGIVEDISERRAAERALRESELRLARSDRLASVGTLAAGVAHEINNPLAYVLTSLDLARRRLARLEQVEVQPQAESVADIVAAIERAYEGADRVRVIVRDLRAFSRVDERVGGLLDVEKVIDSAAELASNEIRHRATLVRDYAGVAPVLGEESRLAQVMVNLLVNAAQAIPEGHAREHRVVVTTRNQPDGRVCISVTDNGIGISPELIGRVFEPFVTTKPVGEGTGLGLSICHGIVTSMGGEITVESRLGHGSTFRVLLPAAAGSVASAATGAAAPVARKHERARVLVVDDEVLLLTTLRIALGDRHDVHVTRSGAEAIELLRVRRDFDVILCDLMMPDVSGIDLYEHVARTDPAMLERIVFMTGGAFTDHASEFLDRVPNAKLEKPFSMDEIESLLRRRAAVRS